jgi:MFS family permease
MPVSTPDFARLGPVRLAPGVRPRHALSYLWAALVSIGIFSYFTALQPYLLAVNLHIPPAQRGVVSGDLQFWQEVIAVPIIGFIGAWSDRTGRRVLYVGGFLLMAVAYAAYPFANNYVELFCYRMIFAVAIATLGGMMQVVLADYPLEMDRGMLAGIAVFLNSLGALVFLSVLTRLPAQFRGAGFSELWAGRASYLCVGGLCVLSALTMLALRPGLPSNMAAHTPIRTLMAEGFRAGRQPRVALAYAASFMARADLVIVALFLALWAQTVAEADGFSPAEAAKEQGVLFAVVQGCALLSAPLFGWLADRVNRVTLVIVAIVLSIVGYGWLGVISHPLASATFPAAAIVGIAQTSGVLATQVLVGQEAPGPIRGSIVGMVVFFGAFGILVISKLGGWAFDHWMPGAPFLIMAMANVALLSFATYVRVCAPGPTLTRSMQSPLPLRSE